MSNQSFPSILNKDFKIIKQVGKGGFGKVFKVKHKKSKKKFALKQIILKSQSKGISSSSLKEISFLSTLNHPNIIQLNDLIYLYQEEQLFLIFEYLKYDLEKYLNKKKILNVNKIKFIAKEILKAVNYCHNRGIIHRDLKPKNILLDKKSKIVKLADFGLSTNFSQIPKKFLSKAGTPQYQAPEILLNQQTYSYKIDIWAFGCLLAEMFYGQPIFNGINDNEILSNIIKTVGFQNKQSQFDKFLQQNLFQDKNFIQPQGLKFIKKKNSQFSDDIENFILTILKLNPQERPSCQDLLSNDFFNQFFFILQKLFISQQYGI